MKTKFQTKLSRIARAVPVALAALSVPALYAAPPPSPFAHIPLHLQKKIEITGGAKPNVMLFVDDSTSMGACAIDNVTPMEATRAVGLNNIPYLYCPVVAHTKRDARGFTLQDSNQKPIYNNIDDMERATKAICGSSAKFFGLTGETGYVPPKHRVYFAPPAGVLFNPERGSSVEETISTPFEAAFWMCPAQERYDTTGIQRWNGTKLGYVIDALNSILDKYHDQAYFGLQMMHGIHQDGANQTTNYGNASYAFTNDDTRKNDWQKIKTNLTKINPATAQSGFRPTTKRYLEISRKVRNNLRYRCQDSAMIVLTDGDADDYDPKTTSTRSWRLLKDSYANTLSNTGPFTITDDSNSGAGYYSGGVWANHFNPLCI